MRRDWTVVQFRYVCCLRHEEDDADMQTGERLVQWDFFVQNTLFTCTQSCGRWKGLTSSPETSCYSPDALRWHRWLLGIEDRLLRGICVILVAEGARRDRKTVVGVGSEGFRWGAPGVVLRRRGTTEKMALIAQEPVGCWDVRHRESQVRRYVPRRRGRVLQRV
jgi:hypothetical protein